MQFHPVLKTLYFSNNGRDNVGGDVPDDYIAYAPVAGLNFGYPYCHRQVAVCSVFHVGIIMLHVCHDQPLPHTECAWCCTYIACVELSKQQMLIADNGKLLQMCENFTYLCTASASQLATSCSRYMSPIQCHASGSRSGDEALGVQAGTRGSRAENPRARSPIPRP